MNANALTKHVQTQGVTLRKAGDPVSTPTPTPAPLVVCTKSLTLGGVLPEADDDLITFRMQRSARSFRKGFPRLRRELLPLV